MLNEYICPAASKRNVLVTHLCSSRLDLKAKEKLLPHFSPLSDALLCKVPLISLLGSLSGHNVEKAE